MKIQISRDSEVSIFRQVAEQIAHSIATGELKPGEAVPSVRALAKRLTIHHNTVSQAYQDLVSRGWLTRRHGRRLTVRRVGEERPTDDLDGVINAAIGQARNRGFTLHQFRQRVRERLLGQSPDHFLLVEEEPGGRKLLQKELQEQLAFPVEACSPSELSSNPELSIGALLVSSPGTIKQVASLASPDLPPIEMTFSKAEQYVDMVRRLREPSMIAVVSISRVFLRTASAVLASAIGERHTVREHYLSSAIPICLHAADIVFCDSIAYQQVEAKKVIQYPVISPDCVHYLSSTIKSLTLK